MTKLEKVLDEKNISLNELVTYFADHNRFNSIVRSLESAPDLTSLNYSTLGTIARVLGCEINDILDTYDINGVSGQITNMKRVVNRIRRKLETTKVKSIKDKNMSIQSGDCIISSEDNDITDKLKSIKSNPKGDLSDFYNYPGFVFSIFNDKLNFGDGEIALPFDFETDYNFINTLGSQDILDSENSIQSLNWEYIKKDRSPKDNPKKVPYGINNEGNKIIGTCPASFIYIPHENGGDIKAVVSVIDNRGNTKYSEVYGCEWLETKEDKQIIYYKSQYHLPTTNKNIQECKKWTISEVEFNRGFFSQFRKFDIAK